MLIAFLDLIVCYYCCGNQQNLYPGGYIKFSHSDRASDIQQTHDSIYRWKIQIPSTDENVKCNKISKTGEEDRQCKWNSTQQIKNETF